MSDDQLYLILDNPDPALIDRLPALVDALPLAAVRMPDRPALAKLRAALQGHGIAVMAYGVPGRAGDWDGCEVSDQVMEARRAIGADSQLGVACGVSRDRAMQAGEDGADYVAFEGPEAEVESLVAWWVGIAELPVVAVAASAEAALKLRDAGADFVALALGDDVASAEAVLEALRGVF